MIEFLTEQAKTTLRRAELEDYYKIPRGSLNAVERQESGGNIKAVSPRGAIGNFQFMTGTAKELGINPKDPIESEIGAAIYLGKMNEKFGSFDLALAAYNAGPGAVQKYGGIPPKKETKNYVAKNLEYIRKNQPIYKPVEFNQSDAPSYQPKPVEDVYSTDFSKVSFFTDEAKKVFGETGTRQPGSTSSRNMPIATDIIQSMLRPTGPKMSSGHDIKPDPGIMDILRPVAAIPPQTIGGFVKALGDVTGLKEVTKQGQKYLNEAENIRNPHGQPIPLSNQQKFASDVLQGVFQSAPTLLAATSPLGIGAKSLAIAAPAFSQSYGQYRPGSDIPSEEESVSVKNALMGAGAESAIGLAGALGLELPLARLGGAIGKNIGQSLGQQVGSGIGFAAGSALVGTGVGTAQTIPRSYLTSNHIPSPDELVKTAKELLPVNAAVGAITGGLMGLNKPLPKSTVEPTKTAETDLAATTPTVAPKMPTTIATETTLPTELPAREIISQTKFGDIIKPSVDQETIIKQAVDQFKFNGIIGNKVNQIGILDDNSQQTVGAWDNNTRSLGINGDIVNQSMQDQNVKTKLNNYITHELIHATTIDKNGDSYIFKSPFYQLNENQIVQDKKIASGFNISNDAGPMVIEYNKALNRALETGEEPSNLLSYPLIEYNQRLKSDYPMSPQELSAEMFAQAYVVHQNNPHWAALNMPQTSKLIESINENAHLQDTQQFDLAVSRNFRLPGFEGLPQPNQPQNTDTITSNVNQNQVATHGTTESNVNVRQEKEDLGAKFARYVGEGIQPITDVAHGLVRQSQADFEALKRYSVPHADTRQAGIELADRLGWNPDEVTHILNTGGVHAATGLAASLSVARANIAFAIENKANAAEFSKSLAQSMNLIAHARANASEIGRGLSYLGWVKNRSGFTGIKDAQLAVKELSGKMSSEEITPERITQALGGHEEEKKIMSLIKNPDTDTDAVMKFITGQLRNPKDMKEHGFTERLLELWKSNLYSGFFSFGVNLANNLASVGVDTLITRPLASAVSKIPVIGSGKYEKTSDVYKSMGTFKTLLSDLWTVGKVSSLTEFPRAQLKESLSVNDSELRQFLLNLNTSKWEAGYNNAIPGMMGKVIRSYGFTPLAMGDALTKIIPYRFELALQKNGMSDYNPSDAMLRANKLTFNSDLDRTNRYINSIFNSNPFLKIMTPVVRTVANVVKESLNYAPCVNLLTQRNELLGGKTKSRDEAVSKLIMSAGILGLVATIRSQDEEQLAPVPNKSSIRAIFNAEHEPLGLKIGDREVSLQDLDPFAISLGLSSALYDLLKEGNVDNKTLSAFSKNLYLMFRDKHYLSGFSDFLDSWRNGTIMDQDPVKGYLVNRAFNFAATLAVPSNIAQTAQFLDHYKRNLTKAGIGEVIQNRIPIWRNELPVQLTPVGSKKDNPRYLNPSPFPLVEPEGSKVNEMLLKHNKGVIIPKWVKNLPPEYQEYILKDRGNFLAPVTRRNERLQPKLIDQATQQWSKKWSFMKERVDKNKPLPGIGSVSAMVRRAV